MADLDRLEIIKASPQYESCPYDGSESDIHLAICGDGCASAVEGHIAFVEEWYDSVCRSGKPAYLWTRRPVFGSEWRLRAYVMDPVMGYRALAPLPDGFVNSDDGPTAVLAWRDGHTGEIEYPLTRKVLIGVEGRAEAAMFEWTPDRQNGIRVFKQTSGPDRPVYIATTQNPRREWLDTHIREPRKTSYEVDADRAAEKYAHVGSLVGLHRNHETTRIRLVERDECTRSWMARVESDNGTQGPLMAVRDNEIVACPPCRSPIPRKEPTIYVQGDYVDDWE